MNDKILNIEINSYKEDNPSRLKIVYIFNDTYAFRGDLKLKNIKLYFKHFRNKKLQLFDIKTSYKNALFSKYLLKFNKIKIKINLRKEFNREQLKNIFDKTINDFKIKD